MRARIGSAVLVAVGLAVPATAQASPPLESGRRVQITWPSERIYAPGERVKVKVSSPRRPARVALLRVTAKGRVMRTVARRTLRYGTFTATLPAPGTYALRVTIAGRRQQRSITAAAPVAAPPPDALVRPPCEARMTGDRAELRLAAATLRAGDTLRYEIVNTSQGCLGAGAPYVLERLQPDGTWINPFPPLIFILPMYLIAPGAGFPKQAAIPADAVPGSYRVLDSAFGAQGKIALTAPFEIVL